MEALVQGYRSHGFEPRPPALELNLRIASTDAARQAFFVDRLISFGLSKATAQYGVLRDIYFSEGHCLSQREIMRIRGVSSANVTRLIHGLEKAELVRRDVNPEDKRSTHVYLTPAGVELCQRLVPAIGNYINELGSCFTDAELALFNEFLARLHAHIESIRP